MPAKDEEKKPKPVDTGPIVPDGGGGQEPPPDQK